MSRNRNNIFFLLLFKAFTLFENEQNASTMPQFHYTEHEKICLLRARNFISILCKFILMSGVYTTQYGCMHALNKYALAMKIFLLFILEIALINNGFSFKLHDIYLCIKLVRKKATSLHKYIGGGGGYIQKSLTTNANINCGRRNGIDNTGAK